MSIEKVLIVDDDPLIRRFLSEALKRKKLETISAENGKQAIHLLKHHPFDLVITDIKMPDLSGIEVLKTARHLNPAPLVILITAYGSIENAVEAMQLGAFHYLIKPFSLETLESMIAKAQEFASLLLKNQHLKEEISTHAKAKMDQIIAESVVMKQIFQDLIKIAKSCSSVFISGESGTGKEVIAHAIHFQSRRASGSFVKVNCAAIPESLIESEFFGHEKGSFTGAMGKRLGRFELADGGTLLLDEISEIPLSLQAKLLRVIQEQEFERVGGVRSIKVDVRLISTSNRNMKEAIEQKLFREDLYYRLNVVPIHLPTLRERREDILPLAEYFLERLCIENNKLRKRLSQEARKKLLDYHWPGNIRELANIMERTVVMDSSDIIQQEHLHIELCSYQPQEEKHSILTLQELEKRHILETLSFQNHNRTKTAKMLGISIRTLRNKLKNQSQ